MSDYWTENGIEKPQRIVVCAACISNDGLILCSPRHWDDTMRLQLKELQIMGSKLKSSDFTQGFIDQFGRYMIREEAMAVALDSGQEIDFERNSDKEKLYSEGLY